MSADINAKRHPVNSQQVRKPSLYVRFYVNEVATYRPHNHSLSVPCMVGLVYLIGSYSLEQSFTHASSEKIIINKQNLEMIA